MRTTTNKDILTELLGDHDDFTHKIPLGNAESDLLSNIGGLKTNQAAKVFVKEAEGVQREIKIRKAFGSTRRFRRCSKCGDESVQDASAGEEVCRGCGFVLETHILSEGQEWRDFNQEYGESKTQRNRIGDALNTWMDECTEGTTLLGASKKLVLLNESTTGPKTGDRILKTAFSNLSRVAEALNLRDTVVENSKEITKELHEQNMLKGRNHAITGLAIVYLACKESNLPRTIKEIVRYDPSLKEKEVGKAINRIKKLLPNRSFTSGDTSAHIVPRLAAKLGLSIFQAEQAQHILKQAQPNLMTAHRPTNLAASSIYLVSQQCSDDPSKVPSLQDIANASSSSSSIIKTLSKQLASIVSGKGAAFN